MTSKDLTSTDQPSTSTMSPAVSIGPNVAIVGDASPDRQQVEPTIAIDPHSPNIIAAGAQDLRLLAIGEHRWHGYYRSTDGGATWSSTLLPGFPGDTSPQGLASPLHRFNATSDPVLTFDRMGNVYYTGLALNITSSGGGGTISGNTAFVAKYTNDGGTYSGITMINGPLSADKPWIAVDTTGGPSDGNVYLTFDANPTATSNFATIFTRSTDGGRTFAPPFYAPADQTGELPGVTVDPVGNVYVSSEAFDPVTGIYLNYTQVTKITNGGTTVVQNVKTVNPAHELNSNLAGASFRSFTIPQIASDSQGVYLVFDDTMLGNANVYLTRSIDGGSTWSLPLRINDVLTGQHFFPTIAVSAGIISVAWYDSRLSGSSNATPLDVFYSDSVDGGVTFSSNVRVTSVSFDPNAVKRTDLGPTLQPFMGDYIQIAAYATFAQIIWSDNRNACDSLDPTYGCVDQDAFTATISLPSLTHTPGGGGGRLLEI
jgi:hypothetical protein